MANFSFSRKTGPPFWPLQKPTDFSKAPYDHVGSSQGLLMPPGALEPRNSRNNWLLIWLCSSPGMPRKSDTPGAFLEMAWHRPGFHRYSQLIESRSSNPSIAYIFHQTGPLIWKKCLDPPASETSIVHSVTSLQTHSPYRCTSTDCSAKCRLTSCSEEELLAFSWLLKGKHGSSLRGFTYRLKYIYIFV